MAETPESLNPPVTRQGYFQKGGRGGPGRAPLPECFTSLEPLALAQLAARATGVVVLELVPEHLTEEQRTAAIAALNEAATDTDGKMRLEASCRFSDRVRGKAKESVEHSGEVGQVTRVILEVERRPEAKTVEGVTVKKALARDAE